MTERVGLVVIGAGGFGPEVVWAARRFNGVHPTYAILGYCDDDPARAGEAQQGLPVFGTPEEYDRSVAEKPCFICAIGDNRVRAGVVGRALAMGWLPATIIDPSVIVGEGVVVGQGTYVGAGSIVSPNARLGGHVIVNHGCSIGHDSTLGDFVQVSPGGRVSGGCTIKQGATLGSNAVVAPLTTVGAFAVVGACSFAATNIGDEETAVGNPARVMFARRKQPGGLR